MKEIVKVLLQEGIDEDVIHEVLDVLEGEHVKRYYKRRMDVARDKAFKDPEDISAADDAKDAEYDYYNYLYKERNPRVLDARAKARARRGHRPAHSELEIVGESKRSERAHKKELKDEFELGKKQEYFSTGPFSDQAPRTMQSLKDEKKRKEQAVRDAIKNAEETSKKNAPIYDKAWEIAHKHGFSPTGKAAMNVATRAANKMQDASNKIDDAITRAEGGHHYARRYKEEPQKSIHSKETLTKLRQNRRRHPVYEEPVEG